MNIPVRATISNAPNTIDELNSNIEQMEADMKKNPQNQAIDEQMIAIDNQEMALEQQANEAFFSGDTSGKYDQFQQQIMLLEKSREDMTGNTLLETPDELNRTLLSAIIANIREKDPHFAPMGTEEGNDVLAALEQAINQPNFLKTFIAG